MKNILFFLFLLGVGTTTYAQCFVDQKGVRTLPVTAAYSTGGDGVYKDKILWLTWGSNMSNYSSNPYGKKDVYIKEGDTSNAEIILGEKRYLCVQAKITKISGGNIKSDIPDAYSILDEMYNLKINGINSLVNAISNANENSKSTITFSVEAFLLDGNTKVPIKIPGLILADAEQINPNEYITMTADGEWNLIELVNKERTDVDYYYNKTKNQRNGLSTVRFDRGSDKKIASVSMLSFNESAYASSDNNYKTTFYSTLYGGGLSALAVGIVPPAMDLGDAPEQYGSPIHLFDGMKLNPDSKELIVLPTKNDNTDKAKFNNTSSALSGAINIGGVKNNTKGSLIKQSSNYLGKIGPDEDITTNHSFLADGDDLHGVVDANGKVINDEDAWPLEWKRFSYKTVLGSNYLPKMKIDASIEYSTTEPSYIVGWIDFNLNGIFEDNERVEKEVVGTGKAQMVWTIPTTRKPYSTYVRLRIGKKSDLLLLRDPKSVVYGGEVEDHRISIMLNSVSNPALLNQGYFK